MAVAGIQITAEIAQLRALQVALGQIFSPADKARILKAALEKAIKPAVEALKTTTPYGVTGNLRRAISKRVVTYTRDGGAVAVIGFRRAGLSSSVSAAGGTVRAGPDRAFHQWWLEEGTKERYIKTPSPPKQYQRPGFTRGAFERQAYSMTRNGKRFRVSGHTVQGHSVAAHIVKDPNAYYYASSFNRLGKFKLLRFRGGERGFVTDPPYPFAFFKKSRSPIRLPPMPIGGFDRIPPLQTAWDRSQSVVAEILQRELRISLEQALQTLFRAATGTVDNFGN